VRESDVAGVEKLKSFRVAETENGRERKQNWVERT
jgi:hypothetical protein